MSGKGDGIPTPFDEAPITARSALPERLAETMEFADDEATDPNGVPEEPPAAALGAMFDEMLRRGVSLSVARACLSHGLDVYLKRKMST